MGTKSQSVEQRPVVGPSLRNLPHGSRFGRYSIRRLVGVGGMAEVYEAEHLGLHKRVALKVLLPGYCERSDLRMRFLREGQAAARIQHAHVVDISDVGSERGVPYLVMEFLDGETVEELLRREGRLEVEEAVKLLLPVVSALSAAHDAGVIHRDLKPENIVLASQGRRMRPKVLDFGVSRLLTAPSRTTMESSVLGTPHYMSPEQARGEPVDEATDQYSLAVMLYEATTGRLPRDRPSVLELLQAVGHEGFPPPREVRPDLPTAFEEMIMRAMHPEPDHRFESMRAFGAALVNFATARAREYWSTEFASDFPRGSGVRTKSTPKYPPDAPTLARENPGAANLEPSGPPTVPKPVTPLEPAGTSSGRTSQPPSTPVGVLPSSAPLETTVPPLEEKKRAPVAWIGLAVFAFLTVAAVVVAFAVSSGDPQPATPPPEDFRVRIQASPPAAQILVDGERVGEGSLEQSYPLDGTIHQVVVQAEGYVERRFTFRDAPPLEEVILEPVAAPVADEPVAEPGDEPPTTRERRASRGDRERRRDVRSMRAGRARDPRESSARSEAAATTAPVNAEPALAAAMVEDTAPATPPSMESSTMDWTLMSSRTDNRDPWAQ
ncbi:MAG: protein kinase [Myxococcota bacterium]